MWILYPVFSFPAVMVWLFGNPPWYVKGYLIAINFVSLSAFVIDKRRAMAGEWRIPERRLHFLTLIGGALGSGAGMLFARHKIRKLAFSLVFLIGAFNMYLIIVASATWSGSFAEAIAQRQASHKAQPAKSTKQKAHSER